MKTPWVWMIGAALVMSTSVAAAQKLERNKDIEAGDKLTFNWTLGTKTQSVEEEWTSVDDAGFRGVQRVGGKEFPLVVDRSARLVEAMCIANGQPCLFSPALNLADYPLEKGKKWSSSFGVKGETFTAEVTQERKVERFEKIKVPAGEFEAAKISFSGRIRGADTQGRPFSGREDGTDWVALVNGKPVVVKVQYRNSFGEKAAREVTSISFK